MKRKTAYILRFSMLLLVLCSIMCLASCGKNVTVKIIDSNVTTEFDAKTNMTVKEILDEAGISLGEKDKTEPESDAKLKDATEITVKRYAKVTVKNEESTKTVELVGATVSEAVKEAGFTLDENMKLDVEEDAYLEDGMVITIKKGIEVSLKADGSTKKYLTYAETVKDFLDEQNITLGSDDEVSPKLKSKIENGTKIVVKRVEYKEETEKEIIYYTTKEKKSSSLNAGVKKVTQEGSNGEKEVTYRIKYVDGKENSREKINEKVTKQAVPKLVTVGTKAVSTTSQQSGKTVVSKQAVYDCDGSGHGYYVITYSDGSVEYEQF